VGGEDELREVIGAKLIGVVIERAHMACTKLTILLCVGKVGIQRTGSMVYDLQWHK
jgi:hypothetical protein